MKKIILTPIFFILYFVGSIEARAFGKGDTLLVYLSDNPVINEQYCDLLELKFPEVNLFLIPDKETFYEYIPEKLYLRRVEKFGDYLKIDYSDFIDEGLRYYFLDISSKFETSVSHMSGGGTVSFEYYSYSLELMRFNGSKFFGEKLIEDLSMNDGFFKRKVIPLEAIDSCSQDINPLFIAMYLAKKLNPQILSPIKADLSPCDIENEDTIYLSEILNNDHVYNGSAFRLPKEREFINYLSYFEHTHIKLHNSEFSARAIEKLSNREHFYFYYYKYTSSGGANFYCLDARDFKVIYFLKAPPRIGYQFRLYVKKFSKFGKKCK